MANQQVTFSEAHQGRSDVALAAHLSDATKQVIASKHMANVAQAPCTVTVLYSSTSGQQWTECAPLTLPKGASGLFTPSLAWADGDHVCLAVASLAGTATDAGGVYLYWSSDAGQTWSLPTAAPIGPAFPALAYDPYRAAMYLVARLSEGYAQHVVFASSTNHGASWSVTQGSAGPLFLDNGHYPLSPPAIAVGAGASPQDSTIVVAWYSDGSVLCRRSTDGGATFGAGSSSFLSSSGGDPTQTPNGPGGPSQFPNDREFLTAPSCAANGETFVIAWTQFPILQVFCAVAQGGGAATFVAELVTSDPQTACYNPRAYVAADGTYGCAYYQVAASPATSPVTQLVFQVLGGSSLPVSIADQPWDPRVGADQSGGAYATEYLLEPFAWLATPDGRWRAVWPDTRSGVRELWTETAPPLAPFAHFRDTLEIVKILFGIVNDGDGFQLPGGHVPPPMGPLDGIMLAANAYQMAHKLTSARGATLRRQALHTLAQLVEREVRQG